VHDGNVDKTEPVCVVAVDKLSCAFCFVLFIVTLRLC